jgi:pyrophosphatase PpaX
MISTVLFDLDGTIVDTNELIISSFLHVIDKHIKKPYTREQIIPYMGMTLKEQLQAFSEQEDVAHLVKEYRAFNNEHHDELVRQFPNVIEVIRTLHQKGIQLGVVTTKIQLTAIRSLELYGLRQYMDTIITIDDVEHPKPHPEPILTALGRLNADPGSTLMVGDSAADLMSAHAAGVRSAAVAWSLKGTKELQKYDPDYILNDMTDLYGLVGLEPSK